jgi:hypothetical protein
MDGTMQGNERGAAGAGTAVLLLGEVGNYFRRNRAFTIVVNLPTL